MKTRARDLYQTEIKYQQMSNKDAAQALGVEMHDIYNWRKRMGDSVACNSKRTRYIRELQDAPNPEAAKILKVRVRTVRKWREELGLPAAGRINQARLLQAKSNLLCDPEAQPPIATASLACLAKRHSMSITTVKKTLLKNGVQPKKVIVSANSTWVNRRPPLSKTTRWLSKIMNAWKRPDGMFDYINEKRLENVANGH